MSQRKKEILIFWCFGIVIGIWAIISVIFEDNKKPIEEKTTKSKEVVEKVFKCNDDFTYMTEYENYFNQLYYKHNVSGLNWKTTKETAEECQYYTTIKVEDNSGNKYNYDLYITTSLDKEKKEEHIKSLIVNNIEVYK